MPKSLNKSCQPSAEALYQPLSAFLRQERQATQGHTVSHCRKWGSSPIKAYVLSFNVLTCHQPGVCSWLLFWQWRRWDPSHTTGRWLVWALRNLLRTHYVSEMAHGAFEDLLCARNCPWCFWEPTMCQKLSIVPLRTYYVAETAHDTFEGLLCVRYSPWYFWEPTMCPKLFIGTFTNLLCVRNCS